MKTKKILSVLLSVIMLLGIIPAGAMTASAADDVFTYDIVDGEAVIISCEITASGDIVVPSGYNGYPVTEIDLFAFLNCSKVRNVYISDSVKEIGSRAFSGCTLLETVTLGKGVEKLGKEIFLNCDSLKKVNVSADNAVFSSDNEGVLYNKDKTELLFYPVANDAATYSVSEKVEKIADDTFSMSQNVKTIILGDNVKEIGNNAFMGSRSLEAVKIGKGVNKIGNQAFNWCEKLTSITVTAGNSVYESDSDGVLYNKGKTEILKYPEGNSKTAFAVPSGIEAIRTHAFLNSENIVSVSFPKSLETIEASAFSGCTAIKEVSFAGSEEEWKKVSIGSDNNAITGAKISYAGGEAHDHKYTETVTVSATCKNAGVKTFKCTCGHTYTETIPATGHAFKDNACTSCGIKEFVLLEDGTNAKITGYNGVGGDVVISETIQGYKITSIGDFAFENKTEITSFTLPESVQDIGSGAFYNTGYYNKASNWDGEVLYIGKFLIQSDSTLKGEYTVKDGTTVIADFAFATAKGLTSITLPKETKFIGDSAFSGCTSLTSVKVNVTEEEWKASAVIGTGNDAFTKASFTYLPHVHEFVLDKEEPAGCLTAGKKISKCKCGETKEEVIPALGHIFADNKCTGCGERQFNITIADDKVTVTGGHASLSGTVKIPETIGGYKVTAIGDNAFAGNDKIEKLILPAGIEKIGEMAFAGSKAVVEFEAANANYAVIDGILYNKARTEIIYCPASKAVKEFVIPSSVTAIAAGAFKGVTVIEKLTVPATVTSIGKDAFSGCTGIKNVVVESTKTQWSKVAIADGNEDLLKAIFTYTDTSDIDDAKALAESLSIESGKAEAQETLIVITADEKADAIKVSRLAKDGTSEVVIKTADTLIKVDADNNYVLPFNYWHKAGNNTETEITVDGNTYKVKFVFPVDETEGHIYDTENPEPFDATCTAYGGNRIYCTICDHSYEVVDKNKPAKGHSFGALIIEKDQTCTEAGQTKKTCSRCGHVETGVLPPSGVHIYNSVVTAPTCTEKGYTTYTCACGKSYKGDETEATGHDYDEVLTKAPECEAAGEKTYTCKVCKAAKTEPVPATGHNYQGTVVAPTYEDKGYTEYKCANGCGASYKTDYVDAIGKINSVKFDNVVLNKNDKHTITPIMDCIANPKWTAEYVVDNEEIITIDENGVITAKTRGITTVSCTVKDAEGNTFIKSFSVEVKFTVWQWIEWFFVDLIYGGLRDFFSSIFSA
ncbi:MAG: leucine-rich repeat domain-containing protein [Clostridia bacterium]|nr:leucine-rich repeat domain-containing protein [Clostridia bacterium]